MGNPQERALIKDPEVTAPVDYTVAGPHERQVPGPALTLCGFLIATLGSMCGIGGGLFTTPLAHYGFRYALRRAVAVSLSVVATGTIVATVTEALREQSFIYGGLVAVLVVSALVGNQIGFWLVPRIPVQVLKGVFVIILLVVGLRVILAEGVSAMPVTAALGMAEYGSVVGLGLLAGILVPILGIGGGLVMVPGLLLLLPEIGYLGTRATSMAVAAVISSRSLLLYARRGELDQRTGVWLAAGAFIGAIVGVNWVHAPGVANVAQILMGVILCLSAVRFAWDVWPRSNASSSR